MKRSRRLNHLASGYSLGPNPLLKGSERYKPKVRERFGSWKWPGLEVISETLVVFWCTLFWKQKIQSLKPTKFKIPNEIAVVSRLDASGQIIIFHGSLGRISLFQIWNKVRSQKSRNSKWGRIVMFFQTTENPTVYLPNDPNLGILRNVSRVKLPKAIPNDAHLFQNSKTPRFSKTARPRSQFLKKISRQDPNEVKRTKEVPPLTFQMPQMSWLWDLAAWYRKTVLVGKNPLDFGMLTIWGGNATLERLKTPGFFQNTQNPITYTPKCPKFGDSEKLTRNVIHFGEVSIHISGGYNSGWKRYPGMSQNARIFQNTQNPITYTPKCPKFGDSQNPITYTPKCPKFGDSEKLPRNVILFGVDTMVIVYISGWWKPW